MKVMTKVRSGCVRVIMASDFNTNNTLFNLWFANFQFLMFVIHIIRKYKNEYDKKIATNNIGGIKRKDRCCNYYCGPGKSLSFMDRSGILGKHL